MSTLSDQFTTIYYFGLELPGCIIYHPDMLYDAIQTLHESLMRRIFLQVIPPIFLTSKM